MPTTRVTELTTDEAWDAAVPILGQLWDEKTPAEISGWREDEDYRLFGLYVDDRLVAVAGVSIQRVLHHVRHAWIHDLVVEETHRREGCGAELLSAVESWAEDSGCAYLALALRDGNDEAEAFYRQQDIEQWGAVMEKSLH